MTHVSLNIVYRCICFHCVNYDDIIDFTISDSVVVPLDRILF